MASGALVIVPTAVLKFSPGGVISTCLLLILAVMEYVSGRLISKQARPKKHFPEQERDEQIELLLHRQRLGVEQRLFVSGAG